MDQSQTLLQYQTLTIAAISALLSALAVVISVIALWQSHFARFKIVTVSGDLQMRIYPIRNGKEKWFIPSFSTALAVTNAGARAGRILGLRLSIQYPRLPITNNNEIFFPRFEIPPSKASKIDKNRFDWMDKLGVDNWMPFIVLPKETVTKYFLFESRWNEPVIQDEMILTLEIHTDNAKNWEPVATWKTGLTRLDWSELTSVGTAFLISEKNQSEFHERDLNPPDLHKYTGTNEPIPKRGFDAPPSYLDYPKS